jgi:hypothetical protein
METEGGYVPCIYENPLVDTKPMFCPAVDDECEWEPVKEKSKNNYRMNYKKQNLNIRK